MCKFIMHSCMTIFENAKAYVMSFAYIIGTLTAGYQLVYGIAIAFGLHILTLTLSMSKGVANSRRIYIRM